MMAALPYYCSLRLHSAASSSCQNSDTSNLSRIRMMMTTHIPFLLCHRQMENTTGRRFHPPTACKYVPIRRPVMMNVLILKASIYRRFERLCTSSM